MTELEEILIKIAKKITQRTGMNLDYNLEVTKGMEDDYDVAIQRGNPSTIYINHYLVVDCLINKDMIRLSNSIAKALDKVPRMTWSLSNENPPQVIAIGKKLNKWIKSNSFESFVRVLSDKLFKVTFSCEVEVLDRLTGVKILLKGNDPYQLEKEAKKRLAQMLIEGERKADIEEFIEMTSPKEVKKIEPVMIIIKEDTKDGLKEEFKYE